MPFTLFSSVFINLNSPSPLHFPHFILSPKNAIIPHDPTVLSTVFQISVPPPSRGYFLYPFSLYDIMERIYFIESS